MHWSTAQSLERKRSLNAYNEGMDKLFTRWQKNNFNNFAIYSDVHRREEVSERTDTLYM